MKPTNTGLLIAFGFVLGITVGMIATPYLIEIEQLDKGPKVPKMIDGYGDVWGGLLSAIVAFLAAYFVWWIQHRKEDAERRELRAIHADALLRQVRPFGIKLIIIDRQAKADLKIEVSDFTKLRSLIEEAKAEANTVLNLPRAETVLGRKVHALLETVKGQIPYLMEKLEKAAADNDIAHLSSTMVVLQHLKDRLDPLVRELNEFANVQEDQGLY